MKINSTRQRLLASSMICGATLLAGQAYAAAADTTATVTEIVVTGTRIPTPNLTSVSPVTTVGSADIKAQGVTRVEDLINSLPQAFAAQGSTVANGSNGTATVNLRGLGSNRTVVLIDGRRLMGGNPTSAVTSVAADLNFIPTPLVERVDILTGGASAVYGADAVAGVVNFIMKKNFEGVRVDAQYSEYQHSQHSDAFDAVVRAKSAVASIPSNYQVPGDTWGGKATEVSLTMGVNAPDGKGNITAYATYRQVNQILASERDFTACAANSTATYFTCGGSGTAYPATFASAFVVDPKGPGNTFRPATGNDVYNFAPTNYLQRPDEKYSLGAFAHYEVAPWADAYMDVMFMQDTSTAQIAPGGVFVGGGTGPGGAYPINCDNPLMSAQEAGLLGCAPGSTAIINVDVARRNVEGGGRTSFFNHEEYRIVTGLKGDITPDWKYDGFLQLGQTSLSQTTNHYFLTSRIVNALDVVNVGGVPTCAAKVSGADPKCVPYNIFALGGVTQAALDYLQAPAYSAGSINERVANFSVVGQLPEGFKSPLSSERVGMAFGAEYRREHLDFGADFAVSGGLLNGAGGASPPVNGGFDVYELFTEARVPLVQDQPFIKDLNLELAYRYSDYSNAGGTNTYKVSGDWTLVDGLRFRVGYNRAVRAPNVVELFSPQNVVLDGTVDPCAGLDAVKDAALIAKCASLFNLTIAQVQNLHADPANQYNGQTGGNPNLKPETADTWTAGVVLQPSWIPGLNITVDYFDIEVTDYINNIGANIIINGCVTGGNTAFCSLVHRDAIGSIRSSQGFVQDTTFNTGGLHTSGVDVSGSYRTSLDTFGIQNMGGVQVNFNGTYLDKLETTPNKGDKPIDCAGFYGSNCAALGGTQNPNMKWRHKARLTWNTPFPYDLALSAQWRFLSDVDLDKTSSDPRLQTTASKLAAQKTDLHLGSRSYLDLLASFNVKDNYSFRIGVNNVLDKDPPLNGATNCPTGGCNQNVWPGVYDALGRYVFVGLTANF